MTKTVLCYGDSNTFGTPPMPFREDARRFDRNTRWPRAMAKALGEDFVVVEEGLPGRTTVHDDPLEGAHKNGLKVLPAIIESHRPIDIAIVMLGTNDLKMRFSLPPYDIAASAGLVVEAIRNTPALDGTAPPRLILVCPPPIFEVGCLAEMFSGGEEKSRRMAALYAAKAKTLGVTFVDAADVVEVSPVDGIHWEAEAHLGFGRHMAGVVRDVAASIG